MRKRLSGGRSVLLVGGLVVVIAALVLVVRWAGEEREALVAVAQPSPLASVSVVPVRPGDSACLRGATLVPAGEVAFVRVGTRGKPGVPLTATASGPGGYRARAAIDGTWTDNDLLEFALEPPDRPLHGEFCLRNDGSRTVDVYAAPDAVTIARTYVDGRRVGSNIQLAFRAGEPRSLRDRAGEIVYSITLFRPGIIGRPVVWALLALTFLALTVGAPLTLWRLSAADADGEPGPAVREGS